MPGEAKVIAERLSVGVALLMGLLGSHEEFERIGETLGLATTLLDHERLAPASHELAASLARKLGCERVAIGTRRSSWMAGGGDDRSARSAPGGPHPAQPLDRRAAEDLLPAVAVTVERWWKMAVPQTQHDQLLRAPQPESQGEKCRG